MNRLKRILALIALAFAACFIISLIVILFAREAGAVSPWMFAFLTLFLLFGLGTLLLDYLQKRSLEERRRAEEEEAQKGE